MSNHMESIDFRTQKQIRDDRRARREAGLRQLRPARVARLLALAHDIERQIQAGGFKDYADVARHHGLTRARVSQIMNLLLLAPDIQEEMLGMMARPGREPVTERQLREVVNTVVWGEQRMVWLQINRRRAAAA